MARVEIALYLAACQGFVLWIVYCLCSVVLGLVLARSSQNKLIWFSDAVLLFVVEWRQNVTGATPGSGAWKCSWWCLVLLRAGGKGTMDQDVTEVSFSPMDAQGLVVKYVRSGSVFSQNAEIRQEDFLNLVVTGMEIEHQGNFSRSLDTVFAVNFAKRSFPAYFLSWLPAFSN